MSNPSTTENRRPPFPPGKSANPAGRPKSDPEVKAIWRERGPRAARYIADMIDDDAIEPRLRLDAAKFVVEHAYGKAVQQVTGVDGEPLVALNFSTLSIDELQILTKLVVPKPAPLDEIEAHVVAEKP